MSDKPHKEKICVLGAGTMGKGIAQVAAVAGCEVCIFDVDKDIWVQPGTM